MGKEGGSEKDAWQTVRARKKWAVGNGASPISAAPLAMVRGLRAEGGQRWRAGRMKVGGG
eukprot:9279337-Pyramimonas_sp.AAC.1